MESPSMIHDLGDLKRALQPVFTEQQTNVLATCLYEYYQPIVHQREMAAIRDTLVRVAETQERTDRRIERLTVAQEASNQRMDRMAAAQEVSNQRIDRLAAAQEMSNERIDRLTAAQEVSNERIDRLAAAQEVSNERIDRLAAAEEATNGRIDRLASAQDDMRQQIESLVEVTKEVVWGIGDLRKQVGGIALSVGQGLEAYALDRIPMLLERHYGFATRSVMPEVLGSRGSVSEIDVVYRGMNEGRPVVVLCEVKTNITESEVRGFLDICERVRPAIGIDDVRVLFFGYRAGESVRRLIAENAGLLAFPGGLVVS